MGAFCSPAGFQRSSDDSTLIAVHFSRVAAQRGNGQGPRGLRADRAILGL